VAMQKKISHDLSSPTEESTLPGMPPLPPHAPSDGPSTFMAELVSLIHSEVEATLEQRAEEKPPNGMNRNDLVGYAISSEQRTRHLERLIWASTGIFSLFVGTVGIVVIIASTHYRTSGIVGLVAAAIASMVGPATKGWRSANRAWHAKRSISGLHDLTTCTGPADPKD
jgi:hypothetical protein